MTPAEELAARKANGATLAKRTRTIVTWVCRLREVRQALKLSADDVAAAVGLTRQAICNLEYGTDPQLTNARKLAAFFGMSVEELWTQRVE